MTRVISIILGILLGFITNAKADSSPLIFAIVVGNNDGLGMLPDLHYADDDALRFYRLATQLASRQNVALLTELDVDTWKNIQTHGKRPPPYLSPSKKELLQVIDLFKKKIVKERKVDPDRPVFFYFFFSGHGEKGYFFLKKTGDQFADSIFTGSDVKYAFSDSQATLNGLFIDACKSQSLFFKKGRYEGDKELGPDFSSLIKKFDKTFSEAPLGVVTSTISDKPAGEAKDIRSGYFSHVLISGLSGGADADSDGVVKFGELASFVTFHTKRIAGQNPWFRPPKGQWDAPLVVLSGRKDLLEILPGIEGHFAIFDAEGRNLLVEINKSEEQMTRIILPPDKYKVVWVKSNNQGVIAQADLTKGPMQLMQKEFKQTVMFGDSVAFKGTDEEPDTKNISDYGIVRFDPLTSSFDQPFTSRIVFAMGTAYGAALSLRASTQQPYKRRHRILFGYGYDPPPSEPFVSGQAITFEYMHQFEIPIRVGARATYAFSDHISPDTELPFNMHRLSFQSEAYYVFPFLRRFEVSIGAYLGWQMLLLTRQAFIQTNESETIGTLLNGDSSGFRAGVIGTIGAYIWQGLFMSANISWGMTLVHQEDKDGKNEPKVFLRPQVIGQVGYAF